MSAFQKSSFDFINELVVNNNKVWFAENKPTYLKEKDKVIAFADELLSEMNTHDNIENVSGAKSLHRIYRDIRFSKDKTPYKNHWSISLKRATKKLRGSYYVHLQPGQNFLGCGFWGPAPDDLKRIRQQFTMFGDEFNKIIQDKDFVKHFGELSGSKLKNGPKGFDKEDPYIELLKYKQFLVGKNFSDKEVLAPNFAQEASKTFQLMRPFLDFMSEALTTDVNGEDLF